MAVAQLRPEEAFRLGCLNNWMRSMHDDDKSADVTFVIPQEQSREEVKVPAHRSVFAAHSEVFHAMLFGSFVESKHLTVRLPEVDPEVFRHAKRFLYTNELPVADTAALVQLRSFAHAYGIKRLEEMAVAAVMQNMAGSFEETCLAFGWAADGSGVHEDLCAAAKRLLLPTAALWLSSSASLNLPEDCLLQLLHDSSLCADETAILKAVAWRAVTAGVTPSGHAMLDTLSDEASVREATAGRTVQTQAGRAALQRAASLQAEKAAMDAALAASRQDARAAAIATVSSPMSPAGVSPSRGGGGADGDGFEGAGADAEAEQTPAAIFRRLFAAVRAARLPSGALLTEAYGHGLISKEEVMALDGQAARDRMWASPQGYGAGGAGAAAVTPRRRSLPAFSAVAAGGAASPQLPWGSPGSSGAFADPFAQQQQQRGMASTGRTPLPVHLGSAGSAGGVPPMHRAQSAFGGVFAAPAPAPAPAASGATYAQIPQRVLSAPGGAPSSRRESDVTAATAAAAGGSAGPAPVGEVRTVRNRAGEEVLVDGEGFEIVLTADGFMRLGPLEGYAAPASAAPAPAAQASRVAGAQAVTPGLQRTGSLQHPASGAPAATALDTPLARDVGGWLRSAASALNPESAPAPASPPLHASAAPYTRAAPAAAAGAGAPAAGGGSSTDKYGRTFAASGGDLVGWAAPINGGRGVAAVAAASAPQPAVHAAAPSPVLRPGVSSPAIHTPPLASAGHAVSAPSSMSLPPAAAAAAHRPAAAPTTSAYGALSAAPAPAARRAPSAAAAAVAPTSSRANVMAAAARARVAAQTEAKAKQFSAAMALLVPDNTAVDAHRGVAAAAPAAAAPAAAASATGAPAANATVAPVATAASAVQATTAAQFACSSRATVVPAAAAGLLSPPGSRSGFPRAGTYTFASPKSTSSASSGASSAGSILAASAATRPTPAAVAAAASAATTWRPRGSSDSDALAISSSLVRKARQAHLEASPLHLPRCAAVVLPLRGPAPDKATLGLHAAQTQVAPGIHKVSSAVRRTAPNALGHDLLAVDFADGGVLKRVSSLTWSVVLDNASPGVPFEVKLRIDLDAAATGPGVGQASTPAGLLPGAYGQFQRTTRYYVAGVTLYNGTVLVRQCNADNLVVPDLPAIVEPLGDPERTLTTAARTHIEVFLEQGGEAGSEGEEPRLVVAMNGAPCFAFVALPSQLAWRKLSFTAGTRDICPLLATALPNQAQGELEAWGLSPIATVAP